MNDEPYAERLQKGSRLLLGSCRSPAWWHAARLESIRTDTRCSKEFRAWCSNLEFYDGLYTEAVADARAHALPLPTDPLAKLRTVTPSLGSVPLRDLVRAGLVVRVALRAGGEILIASDDLHGSIREGGQRFVLASEARDLARIWADDPTEARAALEGLFLVRKVLD
jgi:hypothetical protein